MRLSDRQKEILKAKLDEVVKPQTKCPLCDSASWHITDRIFELREFQGGGIVIGPDQIVLPVIPVSCGGCGYTRFLNAIRLGVVPSPEEAQVEEAEQ